MTEGQGASDRRAALALVPVSRETEQRLDIFAARLREWQRVKNLVAPSTLETLWTRHIADSAQVLALAPQARRWVDLGSGAGLPGLIIAILLADVPGARVDLVEANSRKCAFLRDVARATGAPVRISNGRIEEVLPRLSGDSIEVVTSRALAPVADLIALSRSLLDCGTIGLFLAGEQGGDSQTELQALPFAIDVIPSRTHAAARIVRVSRRGHASEVVAAVNRT